MLKPSIGAFSVNSNLEGGTYLSVFSPNAGKYGPEKTPYLDSFHAVEFIIITIRFQINPFAIL